MQVVIATGLSMGMVLDAALPLHQDFSRHCPVIAGICSASQGEWPRASMALLVEIVRVCSVPFLVAPADQEEPPVATGLSFWQEGHWYPHWERVRKSKQYPRYHTAVPEPVNGEYAVGFHASNHHQDKQDGRSTSHTQVRITGATGTAEKRNREGDQCASLSQECS